MTGIKLLDEKYSYISTFRLPLLLASELYQQTKPGTIEAAILARVCCYLDGGNGYRKLRRKYGSSVLEFFVEDGEVV